MKKRLSAKRQRHSFLTRTKWWLRSKWRWFKALAWWKKALIIAGPILLVALVIPLLTFAYFALTMGDMESLMNRNNTGIVLKDIHGETFYRTGTAEHRDIIPLDQMSDSIKNALIASEDRNFYEHGGVSILSTLRAVYGYVFSGGGEFGGSTLTQQLAKMTLLSNVRCLLLQLQEFSVSIAIDHR
jgi:penicillin-binding protein 2A